MASNDEERGVLVSVLAGIGIGVLVGAMAGLLLAPKSGQETRDELTKSMNDLSDKVTELGRTVGADFVEFRFDPVAKAALVVPAQEHQDLRWRDFLAVNQRTH